VKGEIAGKAGVTARWTWCRDRRCYMALKKRDRSGRWFVMGIKVVKKS
jgi:hypothetical protein